MKGRRSIEGTKLKNKVDYAKFIKRIAGEMYPDAKKITLIADSYGTHVAHFMRHFVPKKKIG